MFVRVRFVITALKLMENLFYFNDFEHNKRLSCDTFLRQDKQL
jgi:hypothetical protein